jgi:predicted NAD/FAD-binding protein
MTTTHNHKADAAAVIGAGIAELLGAVAELLEAVADDPARLYEAANDIEHRAGALAIALGDHGDPDALNAEALGAELADEFAARTPRLLLLLERGTGAE